MGKRSTYAGTRLKVLSSREAEVFENLTDTYCAPGEGFPPVSQTDAVIFIDDLADRSPLRNRIGFQVLLVFANLFPLLRGYRHTFRRLDRAKRGSFLYKLDKSRWTVLALPGKLLKTLAMMSYYGDDSVLHAAGYDPDATLAVARRIRSEQGRP